MIQPSQVAVFTGVSQELFLDILDRGVTDARIRFAVGGRDRVVGRGAQGNGHHPEVTVQVANPRVFNRILVAGSLGLGESFMAGDFAVSHVVEDYCRRHGYPYRTLGWGEAIWKSLAVFYRPKKVFDEVRAFRGSIRSPL